MRTIKRIAVVALLLFAGFAVALSMAKADECDGRKGGFFDGITTDAFDSHELSGVAQTAHPED